MVLVLPKEELNESDNVTDGLTKVYDAVHKMLTFILMDLNAMTTGNELHPDWNLWEQVVADVATTCVRCCGAPYQYNQNYRTGSHSVCKRACHPPRHTPCICSHWESGRDHRSSHII